MNSVSCLRPRPSCRFASLIFRTLDFEAPKRTVLWHLAEENGFFLIHSSYLANLPVTGTISIKGAECGASVWGYYLGSIQFHASEFRLAQ